MEKHNSSHTTIYDASNRENIPLTVNLVYIYMSKSHWEKITEHRKLTEKAVY